MRRKVEARLACRGGDFVEIYNLDKRKKRPRSVDWDFRHDTFMNQWQTYRTRKNRKLELTSESPSEKGAWPRLSACMARAGASTILGEISSFSSGLSARSPRRRRAMHPSAVHFGRKRRKIARKRPRPSSFAKAAVDRSGWGGGRPSSVPAA